MPPNSRCEMIEIVFEIVGAKLCKRPVKTFRQLNRALIFLGCFGAFFESFVSLFVWSQFVLRRCHPKNLLLTSSHHRLELVKPEFDHSDLVILGVNVLAMVPKDCL